MDKVNLIRLPKSYKNKEKIPLDRSGNNHNNIQENLERKSRYKQKYLVEKVMRNRGMEDAQKQEERKIRRFHPQKLKGKFNKASRRL